jgi:cytochrome c5
MKRLIVSLIASIAVSSALAAEPNGEATYNQYCVACHAEAVSKALNSPAVHSDDWQVRLDNATEKALAANPDLASASEDEKRAAAIQQLVASSKAGILEKGMPPMGTCMQCSDADLQAAIEFMISQPE